MQTSNKNQRVKFSVSGRGSMFIDGGFAARREGEGLVQAVTRSVQRRCKAGGYECTRMKWEGLTKGGENLTANLSTTILRRTVGGLSILGQLELAIHR